VDAEPERETRRPSRSGERTLAQATITTRYSEAIQNHADEEDVVIARLASFEGGDAEEMYRINNEMLVERPNSLPSGLRRVIVLMRDDSHWSVVSFFEDEEIARAAEARWEEMGNEIPEGVRGKRVSLESFEVAFDVEMVRT
jgi:hypothetical protein